MSTRGQKPYYSSRNRAYGKSVRWDPSGDEQSDYSTHNKKYNDWKKSKSRWSRNAEEYYVSDKYAEYDNTDRSLAQQDEKWQHDRFEENKLECVNTKKDFVGMREKKPDRTFYKPLKKRSQNAGVVVWSVKESKQDSKNVETNNDNEKGDGNCFLEMNVGSKNYEDRESICSDSTTHSEKEKTEAYISKAGNNRRDSLLCSEDVSPANKSLASSLVFAFSLTLLDGETAELRIYETNEDEIEPLIDKFLEQNNVSGDMRLYLKIHIVNCLRQETGFDETKLEKLYKDLLSANYELLGEAEEQEKENNDADLNGQHDVQA